MKFTVTMKDRDTLDDAIREAVTKALEDDSLFSELDEDEREWLIDSRCEKEREACRQWFEYGEYLSVEVDTAAGTCVVVEVKS